MFDLIGDLVIVSFELIGRYSIVFESEQEMEVFEKEEENTEDWSSGDIDDVELLDAILVYSGQYWWSR